MVFVIGKDEERRTKARSRLADMVKQHNVSVIAIGNGTGCRETEQLVADCLTEELKDRDAALALMAEGFDMLEEDLAKERFFTFARRTYWDSPANSPRRALMQTLIGKLDF